LDEWRESGWLWESFGQMTPIKHEDLWRRVDHALEFHRVQCKTCRIDPAHAAVPEPVAVRHKSRRSDAGSVRHGKRVVLAKRERVEVQDVRHAVDFAAAASGRRVAGTGQAIAPQMATT